MHPWVCTDMVSFSITFTNVSLSCTALVWSFVTALQAQDIHVQVIYNEWKCIGKNRFITVILYMYTFTFSSCLINHRRRKNTWYISSLKFKFYKFTNCVGQGSESTTGSPCIWCLRSCDQSWITWCLFSVATQKSWPNWQEAELQEVTSQGRISSGLLGTLMCCVRFISAQRWIIFFLNSYTNTIFSLCILKLCQNCRRAGTLSFLVDKGSRMGKWAMQKLNTITA